MYGHRLLRELIGLLFIFCGLLMLLSLWSYSPADPSFNQAVTIQGKDSIQNAAGMFGAYLAGSMVDVFGVASFLWVFFFLAVGSGLVSHWLVLKWYRWIGYLLLFTCILTLADISDLGLHGIHGGGLAGKWLTAFSYLFFSPTGSLLLWIFTFLIAMELSFSISWLALLGALLAWLGRKLFSGNGNEEDGTPEDGDRDAPRRLKRLSERMRVLLKRTGPQDSPPARPAPILDIMLPENDEETNAAGPADQSAGGQLYTMDDGTAAPSESHAIAVVPASTGTNLPLVLNPDPTSEAQDRPPSQDFLFTEEEAGPAVQAIPSLPSEGTRTEKAVEGSPAERVSAISDPGHTSPPEHHLPSANEQHGQSFAALPAQDGSASEPEENPDDDPAYASLERIIGETMKLQEQQKEQCPDSGEAEVSSPAEHAPAPVLPRRRQYDMPTSSLLDTPPAALRPNIEKIRQQGMSIIACLKEFRVEATFANFKPGPVVTMFELRPGPGVKTSRITNLANELAMSLKATGPVRMQAPVPGTDTVGVEVPNEERQTVYFREIVENESFRNADSLLTVALGKDIGGVPFSADLAKMPHLLVAGATGKGKSVCLNSILLSLLFRARPDEVQLILIDPKRVEFSMYADLPHLVHPVVTDMDITKNALLWALGEMERRLDIFASVMVRKISEYNKRQAALREEAERTGRIPVNQTTGKPEDLASMPYIVIVVDELADLMQIKRKEVEVPIVRLAQKARAAGIHLIIATQRPSVDIVTGLIKANFPCRIAFQVTNGQDSRTILDCVGAEKLLGNGDMLFKPTGDGVQRLHGAFVSDREVATVVNFWKRQQAPHYTVDFAEFDGEEAADSPGDLSSMPHHSSDMDNDPIYAEAVEYVLSQDKVSISLLQRRFRIGFNKAARYVEQMEQDGIIETIPGVNFKRVIHDR